MSKIAVTRAASLERKLLKAYANVELVTKIECYFDDSAKSIVVHAEFKDEREINEYLGDNTRAWELYRDAQAAIDADIQKQIDAVLAAPVDVTGYEPISEDELQQIIDDTVELADVEFTEAGSVHGLKRLLDDVEALTLCPRCGINELNFATPALNAISKYAPIVICTDCGKHESLSQHSFDLWHDKAAIVAALDEQRASREAADAALQQSIERARQARAERIARETLCEVTPAQKSAIAAAVVWPA